MTLAFNIYILVVIRRGTGGIKIISSCFCCEMLITNSCFYLKNNNNNKKLLNSNMVTTSRRTGYTDNEIAYCE